MAKTKTTKDGETIGKVVRVHNSGKDGYRRAGVKHAKGRVDYPPATFTQEQIDVMQADSKLAVTVDPKDAAPPATE